MSYARKALHLLYRGYRHALYRLLGLVRRTVTIRTRQGRLTMSTRDDGIGLFLFRSRQYEFDASLQALDFLRQQGLVEGDVSMLDVGANIGLISIGLALAGKIGHAIALEPEPGNFALLQRNVAQNGLEARILPLQVAASASPSKLTMELSPDNPGDHRIRAVPAAGATERHGESSRATITVDALPLPEIMALPQLQDFGAPAPTLAWVDIQGYEGYLFRGGAELLGSIPTVAEIWPFGILRAGMTLAEFDEVVKGIWTDYWVERRGRFTRYPISVFERYLDELGPDGHFETVIFTRS